MYVLYMYVMFRNLMFYTQADVHMYQCNAQECHGHIKWQGQGNCNGLVPVQGFLHVSGHHPCHLRLLTKAFYQPKSDTDEKHTNHVLSDHAYNMINPSLHSSRLVL